MPRLTLEAQELVGKGATSYVARQLSRGMGRDTIANGLSRFAPTVEAAVLDSVIDLGQEQFRAGAILTRHLERTLSTLHDKPLEIIPDGGISPENIPIPLSMIPHVPGLFGQEPEGRRVHVEVEVEFEDGRKMMFWHIDLPDQFTPAELYAAIRALMERMLEQSPGNTPFDREDIDFWGITDVINLARRY